MNGIYRGFIFAGVICGLSGHLLASDKQPSDTQSSAPDTSDLGGVQMRPPNGLLKVRKSMPLEVKYCFQPQDGDLVGLAHECGSKDDKGADLAPLLLVSKWSVNGIQGGNDTVGRISAQGAKATYTAPANKPDNATVAVSADVTGKGPGKTMVVSNITILDDVKTYIGKITVSAKGDDINYIAAGQVAFAQQGEGGDSYISIGGNLDVSYNVKECSSFQGVLPLQGELYLDTPEQGQHMITLGTDEFEVSCNGVNIPQVLLPIHPCTTGKGGAGDQVLSGGATCDAIKYSWQLHQQ